MPRAIVVCFAVTAALYSACGSDGGPSCDLPELWSTATSGDGSTCQVNIFTDPEYAVYCGGTTGNWDCACGPAVDNPDEFVSEDFCDLEDEARVCEAIARCGFPL
jgi:hypothetical protein